MGLSIGLSIGLQIDRLAQKKSAGTDLSEHDPDLWPAAPVETLAAAQCLLRAPKGRWLTAQLVEWVPMTACLEFRRETLTGCDLD